jgi:conjugal transfer pilus assembly protein TraK
MTSNPFLAIAASASAIMATCQAQQIIEVTDGGVVSGALSSEGVTRISFLRDRAASVQMQSGGTGPGFSVAHEASTGDLYLTLDGQGPQKRFGAASFFVTTSKGHTYQVELEAKAIPSTQVIIRNPEMGRAASERPIKLGARDDEIIALTKAIWAGALIDGYEVKRQPSRERAVGSVRVQHQVTYEGERWTGHLLSVRNPAPGSVRFDEASFLAQGTVAVTIRGPRELERRDRSSVIVIERSGS